MAREESIQRAWAARGSALEVEGLWREHAPFVARVIRRYVRDPELAADVEQEVWLAVVRGLSGFGHRAAVRTWLHRIAVTRSLNALRDHRRRSERFAPAGDAPPPACRRLGESDPLLAERVRRALRSVTDRRAEILLLHCVAEITHEEIARRLGITAGAVRAQYARARHSLAAALAGVQD